MACTHLFLPLQVILPRRSVLVHQNAAKLATHVCLVSMALTFRHHVVPKT